jgi:hypothetical protein
MTHDTTRVADPSVSASFTKPCARRLDLQLLTGPQSGPDTHSRSSPSARRDAAKWVFTCSPGIHCRAPPRRRGTKGSNPSPSSGRSDKLVPSHHG